MKKTDLKKYKLPQKPGIYMFCDKNKKILYIGRATILKDRVKSYFSSNLMKDRGPLIQEAVNKSTNIKTTQTKTVLDAIILEAYLIKKHKPVYNTKEKDNKSFSFIVITNEKFPKILSMRGREISKTLKKSEISYQFGPFANNNILKEVLKITRKIFPFRDKCRVYNKDKETKPCFNWELGLCPGTCGNKMNEKEYKKTIKEIVMFFEGKKEKLIKKLYKEMCKYAKKKEFENAQKTKTKIYLLEHINDITLIKKQNVEGARSFFRIEGYDVSHTFGKNAVGVMVVCEDDIFKKKDYRKFNINTSSDGDDIGATKEILERRFKHTEWQLPNLIVIDGGKAHIKTAKSVMKKEGYSIPVVSVVKDIKHSAREILGSKLFIDLETNILSVNAESHRFSLASHKKKNRKLIS